MNLEAFLSPSDSARAQRTLDKLSLSSSTFVLTGGVAIETRLAQIGVPPTSRPLNDIDFLVDSFDQVPPSLGSQFIFRHVHPNDAPGKTLLQCVDPETAVRIDIFRAYGGATARAVPIKIHGENWKMISMEDLIARMARLCLDLALDTPMPAKHARDFLRLLPHANPGQMQFVWIEHRKPKHPEFFPDAARLLTDLIAARPDLQINLVYSQDMNVTCDRCQNSGAFVLADLRQVQSLLGYC